METIYVKEQKDRERLFREKDTPFGEHVLKKKGGLFNEIELRNVGDFLKPAPGSAIIDICCSDGRFLAHLAKMSPGFALYGTDFARSPLKALMKKAFKSRLVCCDACSMAVASSSFASAVSIQSFQMIPSKEERFKAISEAFRILTKRGKFVITVLNRETWRHHVENGIEGQLLSCRDLYIYLYDRITFKNDLEMAGFKVKTIVGINNLPNRFLDPLGNAGVMADMLITRFFRSLSLKKGTYLLAECIKP